MTTIVRTADGHAFELTFVRPAQTVIAEMILAANRHLRPKTNVARKQSDVFRDHQERQNGQPRDNQKAEATSVA